MRVAVCTRAAEPYLGPRRAGWRYQPALPLLQQEPDHRRLEATREIKQLSRRTEMAAADPVGRWRAGQILLLIRSLPRCGLFCGEPSGNPGRLA